MNKRSRKNFWDNINEYGFMLELAYEMVLLVDMQDETCLTVTYGQKRFGEFEKEQRYRDVYLQMYQLVDDRDQSIFEKCSVENLRKFCKKRDNKKLSIPYRYSCEHEIWMESTIVRKFDAENILMVLVREISDEVLQEREARSRLDFLKNIAQDVQTPLYTIMGLNELCRRHADNPIKVKNYLDKQKIATEHIMSIVNDMKDMSKNITGKTGVAYKAFSLTDIVKDVVIILQQRFVKRGVNMHVSYKHLQHEDVYGDAMKTSRVLLNIISNIVKYANFGSDVSLIIQEKECQDPKYANYEFCIMNNGEQLLYEYENKSITEQQQESIWTKENESEPELVTIRDLVSMMQGKIYYNIQPGIGSMFHVTIRMQINKEKNRAEEPIDYTGRRILVADDDDNSLAWLKELLEGLGMQIVTAQSGRDAVNCAYDAVKNAEQFDFVIVTWKMPGMDGIETTKLLRKILGFNIPIVMQTAYEWSEVEFRARDVGVNYFALKPLTRSSVLPLLARMNDRVEQMEEAEQIPSFMGKRILLVEPDQNYRNIIEECLSDVDITIEVAQSGKQAIDCLMSVEDFYYDMILLELDIPDVNGYDISKIIRKFQREYTRKVPIVALSGKLQKSEMMQLAVSGINGLIKKPIELRDLYETLRGFLLLKY